MGWPDLIADSFSAGMKNLLSVIYLIRGNDTEDEESASAMNNIVKIRTKEKCQVHGCGNPFDLKSFSSGFACKEHKGSRPNRFFVDFSYEKDGKKKRKKKYKNRQGQILSSWLLAYDFAREIENDLKSGKFNIANYEQGEIYELKPRWKQYKDLLKNPNTASILERAEKNIFPHFSPAKDIRSITQDEINVFWSYLIQKLGMVSAEQVIAFLISCLNYHRDNGLSQLTKLSRPPRMKIDLKKRVKKPKYIPTPEETDRLLASIPEEHRLPYIFQYQHELRPGEVRPVRRSQLNFSKKTVLIDKHYSKGELRQGCKNGKSKLLPIHKNLIEPLRELWATKKEDDILFADPKTGMEYTQYQYSKIFNRASVAAGLSQCTVYNLKHAAITKIVDETGQNLGASKLADHATVKVTDEHYTGVVMKAMRKAQKSISVRSDLIPRSKPRK
jgi:integrase